MDLVGILSTVCSLAGAAVALFACVRCLRAEDATDHTAKRLQESRGRLIATEKAVEELADSFRRLNGRVNAAMHRRRGGDDNDLMPSGDAMREDLDPELAAQLALQRAPAASPGSRNGSA